MLQEKVKTGLVVDFWVKKIDSKIYNKSLLYSRKGEIVVENNHKAPPRRGANYD